MMADPGRIRPEAAHVEITTAELGLDEALRLGLLVSKRPEPDEMREETDLILEKPVNTGSDPVMSRRHAAASLASPAAMRAAVIGATAKPQTRLDRISFDGINRTSSAAFLRFWL